MVGLGNCHGQFVEENLRAFLEGDTVPPEIARALASSPSKTTRQVYLRTATSTPSFAKDNGVSWTGRIHF
jgi:hypothetical protein